MAITLFLRWYTLSVILFWFVIYWQAGRKALEDIRKSVKTKISHLDTVLMITIVLFSLLIFSSGVLIGLGLIQTSLSQNWIITLTGSSLTTSGIIGMFYCRQYLGRFWTAETRLYQEHRVVDEGPYGIVRHPIYTFAILMYLGLWLVYPIWWNLLSVSIIIMAYMLKARIEDRFLEKNLPGYKEYRKCIRYCLLPGVW